MIYVDQLDAWPLSSCFNIQIEQINFKMTPEETTGCRVTLINFFGGEVRFLSARIRPYSIYAFINMCINLLGGAKVNHQAGQNFVKLALGWHIFRS